MGILRPEEEARVRELFAALERPVELLVALKAGSGVGEADTARPEDQQVFGHWRDVDFGAEAVKIAEGLAELGGAVSCRVEEQPDGFPRFPAIAIRPEGRDAGLRYDGLPWGYELGSLIGGVLEAGRREPALRPESRDALAALDRDLAVDVFVTPT